MIFGIVLAMMPILISIGMAKDFLSRLYLMGLLYVTYKILLDPSLALSEISLYVTVSNVLVLGAIVAFKFRKTKNNKIINKSKSKSNLAALFFSCLSIYLLIDGMGGYQNLISSWLVIKEELENNTLSRSGSMLSYCLAVGYYLHSKCENLDNKKGITYLTIMLLIIYAIAIKVKLFIVPVLIAVFYPVNNDYSSALNLIKISFNLLLMYLVVMVVRWSGDLEDANIHQFVDTLISVGDAGVERELLNQSNSVFDYFKSHDPNLGQSFQRILHLPFYVLGIINKIPENPMYEYYAISNGGVFIEGGSAHPGIYADSYAEWSWFGVIFPGIYLVIIRWLSATYKNRMHESLAMVFIFISIALLIRGSTYYGYLYAFPALILFATFKIYKNVIIHAK